MITPKELLDVELYGEATLAEIINYYTIDGDLEKIAQKLIDAVTNHNPRNWKMEPGKGYIGTGEDTLVTGFQPELKIIRKVNP